MAGTDGLDERDGEILARRVALLDEVEGPRVGDYVRVGEDRGRATRRHAPSSTSLRP
jgi:hypothetical protein